MLLEIVRKPLVEEVATAEQDYQEEDYCERHRNISFEYLSYRTCVL